MRDFVQLWSGSVSCVALVTDHTDNKMTDAQTKVYLRLLPFEKQNDTEAFYVDLLCELMAALPSINRAQFPYDTTIRGVLLREQMVVYALEISAANFPFRDTILIVSL